MKSIATTIYSLFFLTCILGTTNALGMDSETQEFYTPSSETSYMPAATDEFKITESAMPELTVPDATIRFMRISSQESSVPEQVTSKKATTTHPRYALLKQLLYNKLAGLPLELITLILDYVPDVSQFNGACEYVGFGSEKAQNFITLSNGVIAYVKHDDTIVIFDTKTGTRKEIKPRVETIEHLTKLSAKTLMFSADEPERIILYTTDGKLIKEIPVKTDETTLLIQLSKDLIARACHKNIQLWNTKKGICEKTITMQSILLHLIKLSHQNNQLATLQFDHTVKLWNWKTGKEIRSFTVDENTRKLMRVYDTMLATYSNTAVKLWGCNSGTCLRTITQDECIETMSVLPNKLLAIATKNDITCVNLFGDASQTIHAHEAPLSITCIIPLSNCWLLTISSVITFEPTDFEGTQTTEIKGWS